MQLLLLQLPLLLQLLPAPAAAAVNFLAGPLVLHSHHRPLLSVLLLLLPGQSPFLQSSESLPHRHHLAEQRLPSSSALSCQMLTFLCGTGWLLLHPGGHLAVGMPAGPAG
jgi:hypothetical protein